LRTVSRKISSNDDQDDSSVLTRTEMQYDSFDPASLIPIFVLSWRFQQAEISPRTASSPPRNRKKCRKRRRRKTGREREQGEEEIEI